MKLTLKVLASLAIVAVAGALIWWLCLAPVQCSQLELPLVAETERAIERNDVPAMRELVRRARAAHRRCPANITLAMVAAANMRELTRAEDAVAMYEAALRYDRRPELYLNAGHARVEAGQADRGIADLVEAVRFAPSMLEAVPPHLRSEVYERLPPTARAANLRNGDFAIAAVRPPAPQYTGSGNSGPAAAMNWNVYVGGGDKASVSTELVPSTRRPGAKMLHVVAIGESTGINQQWAPPGTGPARVQTEAWIFVKRGYVQLGTGNSGSTGPIVYSKTNGTWERLGGVNTSCPANFTMLTAIYPDGAEFYVDSVQIETVPGDCGP